MRSLFLVCVMVVGTASLAIEACSSSSNEASGGDSGVDCGFPTTVSFDCAPISSGGLDGGFLSDGAAVCAFPSVPIASDAQAEETNAVYPVGCGAILPTPSAGSDTNTGCPSPLNCTCTIGASGTAKFICPD